MIEQNISFIRGEDREKLAGYALEFAQDIYSKIDQVRTPGREISSFDLYRTGRKHFLSNTIDFFKDFNRAYDRAYLDVQVEREFTWTLEQKHGQPEYRSFPQRGHFVKKGFMLGTLGKLIEFKHSKYENYTILNEQTIQDPRHILILLGKFATKNDIDYSTR